ncbi:putative ACR [uncultured archaeon]|nr:putative ACR [uncultured archaeon]
MPHVLKYNDVEIATEIEFARTILSQVKGLMFRKSIPPGFAMIFEMKKPSSVNVHMLFMRFPIDIIFLNEEKKTTGLYRLNPWSGYKAMADIKYVIEMNAGTIEKYKLSIGGQMEFDDI